MGSNRRFGVLVAALVVVVWVLAFTEGLNLTAVVCALLSTALSAALILTVSANVRPPHRVSVPIGLRSDTAEFRRELAQLCAALKFGISFCERHPEADADMLLQEVEGMGDAILVFVNQMARPVALLQRVDCATNRCWPDPSGS